MPEVKWLKVPEPEFDFLDFEEAARLLAGRGRGRVADDGAGRAPDGPSQGELLALRWRTSIRTPGHLRSGSQSLAAL